MPWKETDVLDQRTEFVLKVFRSTDSFRSVCHEFGVSAKTGYKWLNRFIEDGVDGLINRSKRPHGHSSQLSEDSICRLIRLKLVHMRWGPKKIVELYERQYGKAPSRSSVHRVLDKAGLISKRRRRLVKRDQRIINRVESRFPNEVWTVDFKGWWKTREGERCEPLTVRDDFSRYILTAVPMQNSRTESVKSEFERLFKRYGIPRVIRSDNGSPFASSQSLFGLTQLSVWFLVLGIQLDRIRPGCPYENGGHERMHRDIRFEVQGVANGDLNSHASSLEEWRKEYNELRPHEALNMKTPVEVYKKSTIKYTGTPDKIDYPDRFIERKVNTIGCIIFEQQKFFLTTTLKGWTVGLKPKNADEFDLYFSYLNLGSINLETSAFTPNPISGK